MRCRAVRPKSDLLRLIRLASGEVVADNTGRPSGRSAYVCADLACVQGALKGRLFERALRRPTPSEQAETLISMAQKAKAAGGTLLAKN